MEKGGKTGQMLQHEPTHHKIIKDVWTWEKYRQTDTDEHPTWTFFQ